MNWLIIAVAGIVLFNVFDGFRRGFIKKSVAVLSLVLTLAFVTWLTPIITGFLTDYTPLYDNLQKKCTEAFTDTDFNENEKTDQALAIEEMHLPDNIKEMLLENNNHEAYDLLEVTGFYEYVGAYLAKMIINTAAYLLSFVIVWTALRVITMALDIVAMLPLLHGINKLAGGVLGAAEGIVLVWIAFLLVTAFCSGAVGQQFFEMISESRFLLFLYENNVIMKIVYGLIF